jgi:hypothetical protein
MSDKEVKHLQSWAQTNGGISKISKPPLKWKGRHENIYYIKYQKDCDEGINVISPAQCNRE